MDAADDPAYYLAEWYLPEMTTTSVDDVVARLDAAALSVSSEGHAGAVGRHAFRPDR
jgi:hypothetical protein